MKEIILRGALLLGILFSLCFFLSFSSAGFHNLVYLLVAFALFCTILCWEPTDKKKKKKKKKKNIELPLQKKKISKNGVPKETYRTKIVTAPKPKKLANNDKFGAVWSPFYF
ncbi:transmembrane protein, putative [Medicago truncatula]|nr:transmembrane protein, putative [Medicago truncatula]